MWSTGPISIITGGRERQFAAKLDLVRLVRCGGVGYCEPGEGFELLGDLDGVSGCAVTVDDSLCRYREVSAAFPGGEQVNVFARPSKNAVLLDGVPAGEREAVTPGYSEPDLREPPVDWIHSQLASVCGGAVSSEKRACHSARKRAGSHSSGHTWRSVSASSQRLRSAAVAA